MLEISRLSALLFHYHIESINYTDHIRRVANEEKKIRLYTERAHILSVLNCPDTNKMAKSGNYQRFLLAWQTYARQF